MAKTGRPKGKVNTTTPTKKKNFLEAIVKCNGNISMACEAIGITRNSYEKFTQNDPKFKEQVLSLIHKSIDVRVEMAEKELTKAVKEGKPWAIQLTLKTLGRTKGYGDKQEIEVSNKKFKFVFGSDTENKENNDN